MFGSAVVVSLGQCCEHEYILGSALVVRQCKGRMW